MTTQTLHYKVNAFEKPDLTIVRAEHLGMCFGVRDAIALARCEAAAHPLTVLGELVHNATVLDDLEQRGVRFENEPERVGTKAAMITAHGASDRARARALGGFAGERCDVSPSAFRTREGSGFSGDWVSSGHHRSERTRGGAWDYGGCGRVRRCIERGGYRRARRPSAVWCDVANYPTHRAGAGVGGIFADAFPAGGDPVCGHGVQTDQATAASGGGFGATVGCSFSRRRREQQQHGGVGANLRAVLRCGASRTRAGRCARGMAARGRCVGHYGGHVDT